MSYPENRKSTDKGFLPPRMTTAERDAIASPAEGLTIYNTEYNCLQYFKGTLWFDLCEGGLTPGPESDCPFIPTFLPSDETVVNDVISLTGETWMDRNLGAYNAARSSTDCWAYGNIYQWGRGSDGHEHRTSDPLPTSASTAIPNAGNPWDGKFITPPSSPYDWLNPQNDNLWQGGSGINNPCPAGYRLPTSPEWDSEIGSWGSLTPAGAYASPLKLPAAGQRNPYSGLLLVVGTSGYYWSSTVDGEFSRSLLFYSGGANWNNDRRATGESVRCIKD